MHFLPLDEYHPITKSLFGEKLLFQEEILAQCGLVSTLPGRIYVCLLAFVTLL